MAGDEEPDEEVEVWAHAHRPGTRGLATSPELEHGVADSVLVADGVSGVRRGGGGPEPVVRGMGWERVQTRVGGVPLYGACPARMDPPATAVAPASVAGGRLVMGLPSVVDGPLTTGGAIEVSLDPVRPTDALPDTRGVAWAGWDGARAGYTAGTALAGGEAGLDYRAAAGATHLGDYRSAGDVLVPAAHQSFMGSVALSARLSPHHRVWVASSLTDERDTSFPALPMDLRTSQVFLAQGGTEHLVRAGAVRAVRTRGGASLVDHTMDNRDKPSVAMVEAATNSRAVSWSAGVAADLQVGALTLTPGLDLTGLDREATRVRHVVSTGAEPSDALWPAATQRDAGVFVEARAAHDRLSAQAGARLDAVTSQAGTPDAASLGGLTVAEQWVAWYGADAEDHDALDWTGGANAVVRWRATDALAVHGGVGLARRAAGITERYFAFAPAPGGYGVGNPTLVPETRLEAEVGAGWTGPWVEGQVAVFGSRVGEYILPMALESKDIDGDGSPDRIQGYVNADAALAGADSTLTLAPTPWLRLPVGAAWVVGRDLTHGEPLAEIPPLEAHLAARATLDRPLVGGHVEVGARLAVAQESVSAAFPEDATPGFALVRAQVCLRLQDQLEVGLAGENLLDADYHEHLSREAALGVGDLVAGDEVPGPGRHLRVWLRWDLGSPG